MASLRSVIKEVLNSEERNLGCRTCGNCHAIRVEETVEALVAAVGTHLEDVVKRATERA